MLLRLSLSLSSSGSSYQRQGENKSYNSFSGVGGVGWGLGNREMETEKHQVYSGPHVRNLRQRLLLSKETLSIHRYPQGGNPQIVSHTQTRFTITETKKRVPTMGKAFWRSPWHLPGSRAFSGSRLLLSPAEWRGSRPTSQAAPLPCTVKLVITAQFCCTQQSRCQTEYTIRTVESHWERTS